MQPWVLLPGGHKEVPHTPDAVLTPILKNGQIIMVINEESVT